MSKVQKYLRKHREYMKLDRDTQESLRGDALWDQLDKIWKRLSPEEHDEVCDTLERDNG